MPNLTIEQFTENPEVQKNLKELKEHFGATNKVVSDVLDNEGNQYVNLVQKGGGVLGVALVGYTYILEEMGIRFLRLAGTSAGAINTALMVAIGDKKDAKSKGVLREICDLDFFSLVDGHPVARWLIKTFITHKQFGTQVKKIITIVLALLAFFFTADVLLLGLQTHYPALAVFTKTSFVLTGFYLLLLGIVIAYTNTLLKRLKDSGFGINPGDFFYDWLKQRFIKYGAGTITELEKKAKDSPELHLRVDNPEGLKGLEGDVTFITSELVTQNKIEFPKMWNLFLAPENKDSLSPAGFVRASMSIPIFFESYYINNIPTDNKGVQQAWLDTFGQQTVPEKARFVDGGILSNFPVNIFYNKNVTIPRLPSFGIDLDDTDPKDNSIDAAGWSLFGFLGRMFNTIRFYYDKDFQLKNKVFKKGIGSILLVQYNWLNFFLSDKDKIDMFVLGAKAACEFLKGFDWQAFKNDRESMQQEIMKTSPTKN